MLEQTSKLFTKKPKDGFAFIYHYWIEVKGTTYHYIGSTVESLKNRAGANGRKYITDINSMYGCPKFADFIMAYGFTNFNIEVLEEVPENDRFIRENYYIDQYDSVNTGLNKIRSSTYNRAEAAASSKTNKVDIYEDLAFMHLPDNESCVIDAFVYNNYLSKYSFGLDHPGARGSVSCIDEEGIHRTMAGLIAKNILKECLVDSTGKTKINFIDKNRRNFRLNNLMFKGKPLAVWYNFKELMGANVCHQN